MHKDEAPPPDLESQISENLRRAFEDRAHEQVPDRFLDLLRQLRAQEEPHHDK